MKRVSVSSSNIASIGYENQILEIEFNNGTVYQYSGIPESEYIGLIGAGSHGKYFNANIKNNYPYTKVN